MLKYLNVKTMKKGFTLLETIVAIFIITVGVVGVLGLVSQTISSVTISSQKLIAAYLTQEGIEIVRNIRDTNWLEGASWDDGLGVDDWEGDYTMTQNLNSCPFSCGYDDLSFLEIDFINGLYSYSAGNETKFKRKITIEGGPVPGDSLNVKVEVFWRQKGKTYSVPTQETLYDWR